MKSSLGIARGKVAAFTVCHRPISSRRKGHGTPHAMARADMGCEKSLLSLSYNNAVCTMPWVQSSPHTKTLSNLKA